MNSLIHKFESPRLISLPTHGQCHEREKNKNNILQEIYFCYDYEILQFQMGLSLWMSSQAGTIPCEGKGNSTTSPTEMK